MAKNLLVINVDIRETRVALIENGIIAELHIERESSKGTVGNIYLGKVSRVLPGMQAAFIDVGLERAAFLHVEDLIRPDDFEAYLAGNRGQDEDRASGPTAEDAAAREPRLPEPRVEVPHAHPHEAHPHAEILEHEAHSPPPVHVKEPEPPGDEDVLVVGGLEIGEELHAPEVSDVPDVHDDEPVDVSEPDAVDASEPDASEPDAQDAVVEAAPTAQEQGGDDSHEPEAAGGEGAIVTTSEGEVAVPDAVDGDGGDAGLAVASGGRRRRSRSGRVRRSGSTADRQKQQAAAAAAAAPPPPPPPARAERSKEPRESKGRGRDNSRDNREGGGNSNRRDGRRGRDGGGNSGGGKRAADPLRVSKQTPIREVVREGQEVIVQISKEPIGTKGARVTSHVSLPGRYVVYLPTVEHVGISKRIGSERERARLREAMEAMKPPQGGLIVRTLGEGLTKKQLKADVGYLVRLWGEIAKKREEVRRAPACLYTELDLVLKTARDLFTDDIEKIVIDDPQEHERLKRFVEMFMPERVECIELYDGNEPIFDAYGIEDEIQRAQSRKVPLPAGGHLIIDQAEALTAIDVNTGRFVGKGSKDLEETILATNLEAVEEIAYQLRFRNIGGLIILDLIDMDRPSNREKVRKRLEELLARDKAKTTLNRISDLGLIEMTRKRTRESLGRIVLEPCFYCDGTGQLQSKQTVAYEILRQIRRDRSNLPGYIVVVNAHPAVVDLLKAEERVAVTEAERLFQRRIELVPRREYHLEQFDLQPR